ncbi:MAG: hypothetical protein NUV46_00975 [Nanoarchaeota archaeon]|nr:hypothetical protein [Nanoarchaeota archaeon]
MKKSVTKTRLLGILLAFAFILITLNFVSAENNVCCERIKTNSDGSGGQWCQMAPVEACDTSDGLRTAPTSCQSTEFCSVGTCVDIQKGLCESGVSSVVCGESGGFFDERSPSEIPSCKLGCCVLGQNGANLATEVRCSEMSSLYGVNINFNPGITSELLCLATAGGAEKGACVYETETVRTCSMLSRSECNDLQGNISTANIPEFYEGYLCSSAELQGVDCGPSEETTCIIGEDEIYFVDTCGNTANIYDSSRQSDPLYWSKIIQKEDSCGAGNSNANSASCGNCNFYSGSTCKEYVRGETAQPAYGDFICKDLGCKYEEVSYQHGEQWCGEAPGTPKLTDPTQTGNYVFNGNSDAQDTKKENLPGSVFTKLTCFNGEITVDNCYDGRQKVCIEDEINGFKNAACMPNSWQECYGITNEGDCMDRNARKCNWLPEAYPFPTASSSEVPKTSPNDIFADYWSGSGSQYILAGACVPLNAPGFDFWKGEGNGEAISSLGTIVCEYDIRWSVANGYYFEEGKGRECLTSAEEGGDGGRKIRNDWLDINLARCLQIGDSGPKLNYLGYPGESQIIAEKILAGGVKGQQIAYDGKTMTGRT